MNWQEAIDQLEKGTLRSAQKVNGIWQVNTEVKKLILEAFKAGELSDFTSRGYLGYVDKHNVGPRLFSVKDGVRVVPGSATVRRGSYISKSVILMSPSYVNIGAYIDQGTLVDSNVLVGSCAQIGKNVHLSAGVQIGGVLEPIGQTPVIIEDDAFIGAGSIIVEGIQISKGAVIAPGVHLSQGIPIFDCVNQVMLAKGAPIPENAVVVPGTRPVGDKLPWAKNLGLALGCAIIIKYRDQKSQASLELEAYLR